MLRQVFRATDFTNHLGAHRGKGASFQISTKINPMDNTLTLVPWNRIAVMFSRLGAVETSDGGRITFKRARTGTHLVETQIAETIRPTLFFLLKPTYSFVTQFEHAKGRMLFQKFIDRIRPLSRLTSTQNTMQSRDLGENVLKHIL